MKAIEKIKEITEFLKSLGIEDAHKESEIIVTHCLGIDKVAFHRDNPVISDRDAKGIDKILERRAKREPLQYILGYVDFYGLKIKVGKGVLIPRPETELLAEEMIKAISYKQSAISKKKSSSCCRLTAEGYKLKVLDLCAGSGCLALAIAKQFPNAEIYGTDISADALRYARENAALNNIRNVTFLQGSLFEPIEQLAASNSLARRGGSLVTFDAIVSNPPYIRSSEITNLQPEIKEWEPLSALDGGENGLKYYTEIFTRAGKHLNAGGFIFLEVGGGQAPDVVKIAGSAGLKEIAVIKDYAGIERIVAILHAPLAQTRRSPYYINEQ